MANGEDNIQGRGVNARSPSQASFTSCSESDCYRTQLPSFPEKYLYSKSDCPWGSKSCPCCLRWNQLCGAIDASEFSVGLDQSQSSEKKIIAQLSSLSKLASLTPFLQAICIQIFISGSAFGDLNPRHHHKQPCVASYLAGIFFLL